MKFFTPRLIRKSQSDRFSAAEWDAAVDSYRAHVSTIHDALTPSGRRFSRLHFHDCRIQRVEYAMPESVLLHLKGFKHFAGGKKAEDGIHRLTFKMVEDTNVSFRHLGRLWSYEEIDWTGRAVELTVLLDDGGRFHIRFKKVAVHSGN